MPQPKQGLTFYFRGQEPGLHIRDLYGGHHVAVQRNGRWVPRAVGQSAPWYNRVDWPNRGRFTRGPRVDLAALFQNTGPGEVLDSPQVALPPGRQNARRVSQQGMTPAMTALFAPAPAPASATAYANAIGEQGQYEWCHLIAHSMGGGDGPANVVAGSRYNNSEQLIIENLLSSYAVERLFQVQVSARRLNTGAGQYLGRAIRYTITDGTYSLASYLNCQAEQRPTQVHLDALMERIARWLNQQLLDNAARHVTPLVLQALLRDCPQFAEDEPADGKKRGPDDDLGDGGERLAKRQKRKSRQ